jgi:co-chaperonin GroES (HSP10)
MTAKEPLTATSPITSVECAPNVLLVRVLDQAGVSRGGIILPDCQRDAPCQGVVVETGELMWSKEGIKFAPKKGDRISMKRFGFSEITLNDEVLRQIGIADVLCILR